MVGVNKIVIIKTFFTIYRILRRLVLEVYANRTCFRQGVIGGVQFGSDSWMTPRTQFLSNAIFPSSTRAVDFVQ
jgi:hypothetical protein